MIEDKRNNVYETPDSSVKHAVCLVSGGMDSTTCLFHAVRLYGADNVKALSAYYGQKSDCELKRAKATCAKLGVERFEVDLSPILAFNKDYSSYIKGSDREIEDGTYAEILQKKFDEGKVAISDEYIPNRNSLLLNVVCSLGLQLFNNEKFAIISGIHADDAVKASGSAAAAYPDCSTEFAQSINMTLQEATANVCYVYTPLVNKSKIDVAKFGVENGMTKDDFKNTWSCYKGESEEHHFKPCGKCPTDRDRQKAEINGVGFTLDDILEEYDLTREEAEEIYREIYRPARF